MNKYLKKAIVYLILIFALFALMAIITRAQHSLVNINPFFFIIGAIFFMISVLFWLISWANLLKKHVSASYKDLIVLGVSCLYGSLTPIQLGADALRSIRLKEYFGVKYSQSISASFIVKGIKFLILALFTANIFLLFLFRTGISSILFYGFLSGFFIVLLASFCFLMPLKKEFGYKIADFFGALSELFEFFSIGKKFFIKYTDYLQELDLKTFLLIFILVFFSWIFEFFSLQFAFISLGLNLTFHSLLVLMVLVAVLERTPFLPRGIGLVELVAYHFLAFPSLIAGYSFTAGQIGAVLILFDIFRLVVPTIVSMFFGVYVKANFIKIAAA